MQTETAQEKVALNDSSPDQKPAEIQMVPFSKLLQFATAKDKFFMFLGGLAAAGNGLTFPLFSLIFGNMADSFGPNATDDQVIEQAGTNSIWFVIVGLGTMLLSFIMFSTWMITGERQAIQFRKRYFSAILSQDISWFDTINPNELSGKVANETFSVQGAIGEKVPTFIMTFAMSFFGFLIGYIRGWQLALVITCTLPAISIATAIMAVVIQNQQKSTQAAYSQAGALAEQAINAVKTVKMLDGEDYECDNYRRHLNEAAAVSIRYGAFTGLAFGLVWGLMILSYALGFWYGSVLISDGTWNHNVDRTYTVGDVFVIFFAILTGGFSLGQAGPCIQNFAAGKASAVEIFKILERKPIVVSPVNPIKITVDNPLIQNILQQLQGEVTLNEVQFTYPNRPQVQILKNIQLTIPVGKKIALVGESGCGKSTIMQLIERFYDCESGQVLVDGIDVRNYDLNDLREHIGYVGQEPVLFATSIRENLRYGKKTATDEEMIQVLKEVNAWDFISKMDKGLDTYVGIGGGQLSGGQKQRVAIARAILKRPQILLLDEATSALDRTNELLIQNTLDEVSKGITTIVIAHRLSTIQNSDLIYVIDAGVVVEKGTHQTLINAHGKYEALSKNQMGGQEAEAEEEKELDIPSVEKYDELLYDQFEQEDWEVPYERPFQTVQNRLQMQGEQGIVQMVSHETRKISDALIAQLEAPQFAKQKSNNRKISDQKHEVELQILDKEPLPEKEVTPEETEEQKKERLKKEAEKEKAVMNRLFSYNKDYNVQYYIGLLAAAANGTVFPIFSLFLSEMINVLSQLNPNLYPPDQRADKQEEVQQKANRIAIAFLIIALSTIVLWCAQIGLLSFVGEKLTLKIRLETYRKLLRMPIAFFDIPKNNAGTLTSRLSVDAKLINGLTSTIIGINIMNFSSLISGMVIAFVASWQLTLVSLALSPLVFVGGALQAQFMQGFADKSDSAYKDSGNLIMEAVTNIRTVQSFGNQEIILDIYSNKVKEPLARASKKGIYAGVAFGFSQMQMFLIYAVVFYVGALLHKYQGLSVLDMYTSIFGIMFSTFGAGNNAHFAGDIGAAKNAAKNIFELLDLKDEFQVEDERGGPKITSQIKGDIEIKSVSFKYESRDKKLFEDLNLVIKQGNKISFVGPSGCGKSTIMQFLLRFYEPQQGEIIIDGVNIKDYDLRYLRRQFAIVSQEPVLFNCSIKENIIYNQKHITMQQVTQAAEQANALQFILRNEFEDTSKNGQKGDVGSGFDRQVGPKGGQISGGQKQRIGIARAILRNAHILLLDEATSALDAANEQVIQESLNNLMKEKTTIAIAHRISTIKDSHTIYVFEEGKIVEQGNYQDLVNQKGFFFRLEKGIAHNL